MAIVAAIVAAHDGSVDSVRDARRRHDGPRRAALLGGRGSARSRGPTLIVLVASPTGGSRAAPTRARPPPDTVPDRGASRAPGLRWRVLVTVVRFLPWASMTHRSGCCRPSSAVPAEPVPPRPTSRSATSDRRSSTGGPSRAASSTTSSTSSTCWSASTSSPRRPTSPTSSASPPGTTAWSSTRPTPSPTPTRAARTRPRAPAWPVPSSIGLGVPDDRARPGARPGRRARPALARPRPTSTAPSCATPTSRCSPPSRSATRPTCTTCAPSTRTCRSRTTSAHASAS